MWRRPHSGTLGGEVVEFGRLVELLGIFGGFEQHTVEPEAAGLLAPIRAVVEKRPAGWRVSSAVSWND